jgi:hypothetical protein
VRAVRITLTARTSSQEQGFTLGSTGGAEDRTTVATNDGYLRRTVTTEIQMRNQ